MLKISRGSVTGLLVCLGSCCSAADLTLDGRLDDSFWQSAQRQRLTPGEKGVPADLGGEVWVKRRGEYLCLAARLPEPGGKVLAHSAGRNPTWEEDLRGAPPVEDRILYTLRVRTAGATERNLTIAINPWGAYRVEEGGRVVAAAEILRAAEVTPAGWTVEAAIPAALLEPDPAASSLSIRIERIRSRRALTPEYRWTWPAAGEFSAVERPRKAAEIAAPEVGQPPLGNTGPPLEVGRVTHVPPAVADWGDKAWSAVPEFVLGRNEALPRAPRRVTHVKWMHDGRNLALFFYAEEPEPVMEHAEGRDSAVSQDDNVAVYLATSGSAFVEISVNSAGVIRDGVDRGPRWTRPNYGWNANIDVQTDARHGRWLARLNIPLDQCAAALGETGIPAQWRILLTRFRAARPGEVAESSTLPTLEGSSSVYGPLRYQAMILHNEPPTAVKMPQPVFESKAYTGLTAEIAGLESNVWSPLERRYLEVRTMVQRYLQRQIEKAVLAEREAWDQVKTRTDWEHFRDERIQGLRESMGKFPPERPPLDVRISGRRQGDGYLLENLVFQSRPGFYVTANLYLPEHRSQAVPGIVIVHSQHFPKTEWELQDSGQVWARAGCAVLIIERPGFGERAETNTWYRQAYASRFTFTKQLYLIGENYSAWQVWDVIRSVDFLFERPEIDRRRIILIGAVAGGGELAAVAAALDSRVTAVIPYNYDQGHLRVHGDAPGQIARQFSPWLVAASAAPRRFVRPFEFGWETSEETDVPRLWVDGMVRSEKVWGFYDARDSLAEAQGFGFLRNPAERRSPCENLGPEQRASLYPVLERWFGIPWPSPKDQAILPSSELSTNSDRDAARRQEAERLRPSTDLLSIPPALSEELSRKAMHQIAYEMGQEQLQESRQRRSTLPANDRARQLRDELRPLLGDIEPPAAPKVELLWKRRLSGANVEAIALGVEEGVQVPLLLLMPETSPVRSLVVGVAQGGKDRFLSGQAEQITTLLHAGVAVCLPDVRGTGETAFSQQDYPYGGVVQQEFDLSKNLLGSRLKDLRTVLAYLRQRTELRGAKIALWGESFAMPNPANLYLDELEYEAGPQIQHYADPLGAHLALLAGLYEPDVRAVAAVGGLSGYLSMLADAFTYTPLDVVVRGILKAGDITDITGAIAPRPVALAGLVNGRNVRIGAAELEQIFQPARRAYEQTRATDQLMVESGAPKIVQWLIAKLSN